VGLYLWRSWMRQVGETIPHVCGIVPKGMGA
jgi:hypothetical protein